MARTPASVSPKLAQLYGRCHANFAIKGARGISMPSSALLNPDFANGLGGIRFRVQGTASSLGLGDLPLPHLESFGDFLLLHAGPVVAFDQQRHGAAPLDRLSKAQRFVHAVEFLKQPMILL